MLILGTFEAMRRDARFRLTLAAAFGLGAVVLNLVASRRPSHGSGLAGFWELLNILPFFLSLFIAGNPHSGSQTVIFILSAIQWAAVGDFVGKLLK